MSACHVYRHIERYRSGIYYTTCLASKTDFRKCTGVTAKLSQTFGRQMGETPDYLESSRNFPKDDMNMEDEAPDFEHRRQGNKICVNIDKHENHGTHKMR